MQSPRDGGDTDSRRRTLARTANIELIPLRGTAPKLSDIPSSTTLTITCSPKWGLGRTLDLTELAAQAGFRVVPHIAARQVTGEPELRTIVDRLTSAGVRDIYVIGGDADEPAGEFSCAGDLLEVLAGIDHPFGAVGIGCYPEGHPKISDDDLAEALRVKQRHATYLVSQLCFDPGALLAWLRRTRQEGITLPLRVGVAAPLQTRKLMELSLRIGVGSSIRYLTKQHGLLGSLLRGGAYRPERLIDDLLAAPDLDDLGVEKLHLYSFNQIEATIEWQQRISGSIAA